MWARKPGFATLIQIILEQQVSLASAAAMFNRLQQRTVPLEPGRIVELGESHLRELGFTRQKTTYCLDLANSILESHLEIERLPKLEDEAVRAALMEIKGIGSWSADVYLLMVLRRPDIWPASDLALATAAFEVKRLKQRPSPQSLTKLAEPWRPFRSVAARMLWQAYLARKK